MQINRHDLDTDIVLGEIKKTLREGNCKKIMHMLKLPLCYTCIEYSPSDRANLFDNHCE